MISEAEHLELIDRAVIETPLDHKGLSERFVVRHWRYDFLGGTSSVGDDGEWIDHLPTSAYAYDKERGRWMEYRTETGWTPATGIMAAMADVIEHVCTLEAMRVTIDEPTDEKQKEKVRSLRQRWVTQSTINGCLAMAAEYLGVDKWDSSPTMFGLPNGMMVAQVRNGYKHLRDSCIQDRTDYITKSMAREPASESDLWKQFMKDVTGDDAEFANALQMWVGASVFTGNALNKVHILYGDGGSGKSVFLRAIQYALGSYAGSIDPAIFTDRNNQHPASLLPLVSHNFVVAPELAPGSLKSSLLKFTTGDDPISLRAMRQNPTTQETRATIWFSANELPTLRLVDKSLRRRLMIWPFDHAPERENPELSKLFRTDEHQSGIVRWIIDGMEKCLDVQAEMMPMPIPEAVKSETETYLNLADSPGLWVDEDTMPASGKYGEKLPTSGQLFTAYGNWCKDNEISPLGKRPFVMWMARHFEGTRRSNGTVYPIVLKAAAVKGRERM